jgi:hypothetical protein
MKILLMLKRVIKMNKPTLLKNIDLEDLENLCQEYLDYIDSEEYCGDSDYDHFIFEKAMETLYGEDIFDYINDKLK